MKQRMRRGVVAELDGQYWGIQYEDGHGKSFGFGGIEMAEISDPRFCKRPTDMTYPQSPYLRELERAKLVPIKVTTTYEIES